MPSKKKVTGWTMAYLINGVPLLICVSARSKKAAAAKFEEAGYIVKKSDEIRHSVLMKYPGPPEVKRMKRLNWERKSKPITKAEGIPGRKMKDQKSNSKMKGGDAKCNHNLLK